jgi:hypothetical protein
MFHRLFDEKTESRKSRETTLGTKRVQWTKGCSWLNMVNILNETYHILQWKQTDRQWLVLAPNRKSIFVLIGMIKWSSDKVPLTQKILLCVYLRFRVYEKNRSKSIPVILTISLQMQPFLTSKSKRLLALKLFIF